MEREEKYIETLKEIKNNINNLTDTAFDNLKNFGLLVEDSKNRTKKVPLKTLYPLAKDLNETGKEITQKLIKESDNYLHDKVALLIDLSDKSELNVRNLVSDFNLNEIKISVNREEEKEALKKKKLKDSKYYR